MQFLRDMYSGLLAHAAAEIGELFRGMAAADALPTLFHCTAGKDRTGVVAALLLTWLGVDRELVLDDFELTEQSRGHQMHEQMFQRMLERGMSPEAAAGMLHATAGEHAIRPRRARFALRRDRALPARRRRCRRRHPAHAAPTPARLTPSRALRERL